MVKYIEIDKAIETALLLLEEGEDEQTLAYNAALVAFVKNMENQLAADVVEVVRCKDCKYRYVLNRGGSSVCNLLDAQNNGEAYCSYGERKDG